MRRKAHIVAPGNRSAPLAVAGTDVTVLLSDEHSDTQQVTFQSGKQGSGPPPHSHGWDESFFVIRGEIQFTCDGETTSCGPGTLVHIPAGTIHAFSYGAGGGEMLEVTSGATKSVQSFIALDREIPPGPPDVPKIVQVAGEYGVTFHL